MPRWLYEVRGSLQRPFSTAHSDALEKLFSRTNTTPAIVDIDLQGVSQNIAITSHDLDLMEFHDGRGGKPGWLHRQVDDADVCHGVAFWDGLGYTQYEPQASTLVVDASRFGRKFTAISVGSGDARVFYNITLGSMPTQMRSDTHNERPLFIPASFQGKIVDYPFAKTYSVEEYARATADLPQGVLDIITCPISRDIMRRPVVAADGHSYDERGIMQWLKTHDTSPLTGAKLSHKSLIPNISLYQLIDGLVTADGTSQTPPSSPAEAADEFQERKAPKKQKKSVSAAEAAGKAAAKRALTTDEDKAENGKADTSAPPFGKKPKKSVGPKPGY